MIYSAELQHKFFESAGRKDVPFMLVYRDDMPFIGMMGLDGKWHYEEAPADMNEVYWKLSSAAGPEFTQAEIDEMLRKQRDAGQ
jgi:hypothetical protein